MPIRPSARRKARRLALQAIYQWQMSGGDIADITQHFTDTSNPKKVDIPYFSELISGVMNHVVELDKQLQLHIDRQISELNRVECAVLRIAMYELIYRLDIPYKVVINEALETAKAYGAETSFKYVNGVLDKAATTRADYEV